MIQLNVPYRSQWAADAADHNTDCGPTCVAMILNYRGVDMTPDGVYADIKTPKGTDDYTSFTELILATRAEGAKSNYRAYADRDEAMRGLRANLDSGSPGIALVKYTPWQGVLGNTCKYGHFVVVTGYTEDQVLIHDPLFGVWRPAAEGVHYAMDNELFAAGWGGFPGLPSEENPNWAIAYNGDVVDVGAAPAPQPKPGPVPVPVTPAPPTPAAPIATPAPSGRMEDVNRRIRTLAAYRWANPPNFNDPASVQVWADHLGDFGLEYDTYVVQSGDTLSGLAASRYGQQNRWPALQAYNNLTRSGLWLNETILIPRLGQSGAQADPALPSDTVDLNSKDLEALDDESDQPALDYNDLVAGQSKGIGYVDLPDA